MMMMNDSWQPINCCLPMVRLNSEQRSDHARRWQLGQAPIKDTSSEFQHGSREHKYFAVVYCRTTTYIHKILLKRWQRVKCGLLFDLWTFRPFFTSLLDVSPPRRSSPRPEAKRLGGETSIYVLVVDQPSKKCGMTEKQDRWLDIHRVTRTNSKHVYQLPPGASY